MWKQKPIVASPSFAPHPEPIRPTLSAVPDPAPQRPAPAQVIVDQAVIGKGIIVRGDITGSDALFIDGTVEGSIHIPGERVTIGRHGTVLAHKGETTPCITAQEIVILGTVTGNVIAAQRIDIRAEGTLTGDVSTARVSIEDGAYFRGGIDILRDQPAAAQPALQPQPAAEPAAEPVAIP